ncbi:MMPL family transporter [Nocardia vaccinii]|uniref:MMPL family transporter n=1 Tax=Nocardia vaccinii TaxID=1822 RepID=UPI00082A8187|nr:MMPL family transporter [Nocardia vaccinii]
MTHTATPRRSAPAAEPRLRAAGRWGRFIARHHRIVLCAWLLLAVLCGAGYPTLHTRLGAPDYTLPGSSSQTVDHLVTQHFSRTGIEQDLLVFHSPGYSADSPQFRAAIDRALPAARAVTGVVTAIGPFDGSASMQISRDRHTALAVVGVDGSMSARNDVAQRLQKTIAAVSDSVVQVSVTGYSPVQADLMRTETADLSRAEAIGVPVAAVLLALALGATVAAAIPITVTAAGIALAVGILFGLTIFLSFDSLVLSVATMIATGTAIDYAMFIVSRFNEELTRRGVRSRREREAVGRAVGVAMDTAGRTVLASGLIVAISLCSLVVVGLPMLDGVAAGVLAALFATLTSAFTLLPAMLSLLGPAINRGALPTRLRPAETRSTTASHGWARWAHAVMRRPVLFGSAGVAVLAVAALPLTGLRYGVDMGLRSVAGQPTGQATRLVQENFGPGLLAPIEVVATGADDDPLTPAGSAQADRFIAELSHDSRIATVLSQPGDGRLLAVVVPRESFDSTGVSGLVSDIRSRAENVGSAQILVGGTTATFADVSARITSRFPWVITLVLSVSLIFLVITFRSIVLALKAIALNLLATGAALGLTVLVFEHGVGESVLAFHSTGFLQVYLPMLVFAVLFGLSMDYEVFLIRRMREAWDHHADNASAVAEGLQRTARPISAAAAIMVAVFASFITAEVLELKQIGFALAVAIALDALIVRLVLVPAFMRLFGRWNWWLPRLPIPRHRKIASTASMIEPTASR